MVMNAKRVLSVGQCAADQWSIARTLSQAFGAEVLSADSASEALDKLCCDSFALVLVNRIFDADGFGGLELIKVIRADPSLAAVPVMLVSNYDDAQSEAVAVGAVPGFGKAALGRPAMLELLAAYLR
jgi:two-component system chemotaxis response regulator CheY